MTAASPVRLALSMGDPNGIGPEIALRTLAAYAGRSDVSLTLFGAEQVLRETAQSLGLQDLLAATPLVATQAMPAGSFKPGEVSAAAGAATVDAASRAIEATRRGEFDAIVAAPHHETAIARAGIAFSGYPSLLARVCGQPEGSVFMMLMGGGLRLVHVTLHESVATALGRLTPELVVQATLAGLRGLRRLGIENPKVAIMGINPHASEDGLFGPEDGAITVPAAQRLRALGHDITGPVGGDLLLAARAHDLYVAIFHDQGHIPIKLLSPQRASAWSVGADVILSSVGHGSAMDIAGKGVASARAMIETVALLGGIPVAAGGEGVTA